MMVCANNKWPTLQIWSKLIYCPQYCLMPASLFVWHNTYTFGLSKGSTCVVNHMLSTLMILGQDSAKTIVTCIAIHNEGLFKVGVDQQRSRGKLIVFIRVIACKHCSIHCHCFPFTSNLFSGAMIWQNYK